MNGRILPNPNLQETSDNHAMISFEEIRGKMLTWVQSGFRKSDYRLFHKKKYLGNLKIEQVGSAFAIAETSEAKWSFRCTRLVLPRVTVRSEQLDCVGFYEAQRTGVGIFEYCDGRQYSWVPMDTWQTEWGFFRDENKLVAGFIPEFGMNKNQGIVRIKPKNRQKAPLELLIFFGWYLILLEYGAVS
jgi:hypothetical protein